MNMDKKYLYNIYVTTSNFEHANSLSNVSIQLFGKSKRMLKSFKFPLVKSKTNLKKFQQGRTDLFEIEEIDIGEIKKIVLTHYDKQSSGLHIKNIKIEIPELKKSWNFYCDRWLKDVLELKKFENTSEKRQPREGEAGNLRYTIKILTSECTKLDFDPIINLKLIGKYETRIIKLNSTPSDNNKPKFKSGNIDTFRMEEKDVDQIKKLVFYCQNDENGRTIDWFYDSITVDIPKKLLRYEFNRKSRTDYFKEKDQTLIEVYPFNVKKISNQKNYCINLYTNKLRQKPELLQNMSMILYGDYSISPELKLSELKSDCCGRSINDELIHFHLKHVDIGPIYKLKLICLIEKKQIKEFKNFEWFLTKVEIDYHKDKYVFYHQKAINFKKYDLKKKIEIKLYEQEFNKSQTRTICTLSHRLLEESIKNDSYDETFEESDNEKHHKKSHEEKDYKKRSRVSRESSFDKADLKSKLRFDQDLEELVSSDSTLSILSSNSHKSSAKKKVKSPASRKKSQWSSDESLRKDSGRISLSPKKSVGKIRNEWSSEDDNFRVSRNNLRSPMPKKESLKKRNEWSSDDSFELKKKTNSALSPKYKFEKGYDEKSSSRFNRSPSPNLRTLERPKSRYQPRIDEEEYDRFDQSPKFSSSFVDKIKSKNTGYDEKNFLKSSIKDYNDKLNFFKSDRENSRLASSNTLYKNY